MGRVRRTTGSRPKSSHAAGRRLGKLGRLGRVGRLAVVLLGGLLLATNSQADVMGLTGLLFADTPIADLGADDFAGVPNGFIQPNFSSDPDVSDSTAEITGFTTGAGPVRNLRGPVDATGVVTFPAGLEPPVGDVIRNVWGFQGPELPGIDAILGTNVGAGLDNAGATGDSANPIQPFDVHFGTEIDGAVGAANDFFLIDIIGDDAVSLQPLDLAGEVIGDHSLTLASGPGPNNFGNSDLGDFGLTGFDLALFLENGANIMLPEEIVIDDVPLAGVAFDIEDLFAPGAVLPVAGLRITPLDLPEEISSGEGSIDLIAIGFSAQAAVPEPGSAALLLAAGVLTLTRWPRGRALRRKGRSDVDAPPSDARS